MKTIIPMGSGNEVVFFAAQEFCSEFRINSDAEWQVAFFAAHKFCSEFRINSDAEWQVAFFVA